MFLVQDVLAGVFHHCPVSSHCRLVLGQWWTWPVTAEPRTALCSLSMTRGLSLTLKHCELIPTQCWAGVCFCVVYITVVHKGINDSFIHRGIVTIWQIFYLKFFVFCMFTRRAGKCTKMCILRHKMGMGTGKTVSLPILTSILSPRPTYILTHLCLFINCAIILFERWL